MGARGWSHPVRLQHPEGVHLALGAPPSWWCQETKKKNYTTPKKATHKHKKVKFAVLKFYKVDENGKINRLRRECPGEKCGAGVFMAAHKDRQYCGKCGKTFVFNAPETE